MPALPVYHLPPAKTWPLNWNQNREAKMTSPLRAKQDSSRLQDLTSPFRSAYTRNVFSVKKKKYSDKEMTSPKETREASAPSPCQRSPQESGIPRSVTHTHCLETALWSATLIYLWMARVTRHGDESLSQGREKPKQTKHSRAQKLNLCRTKTFKKESCIPSNT